MTRLFAILSVAGLSACSGVSSVCDHAGRCLEVWRNAGAFSSVTHAEMTGPGAAAPFTVAGGGWVSAFDPLSSSATTAATDARTVGIR